MKLRDLLRGTPAHPKFVPAVDILETERLEPATEAPPTPPLPDGTPAAYGITRLTEGWDMPAAPDPQCTATTRTGNRCKLPRAVNSDKCAIHER